MIKTILVVVGVLGAAFVALCVIAYVTLIVMEVLNLWGQEKEYKKWKREVAEYSGQHSHVYDGRTILHSGHTHGHTRAAVLDTSMSFCIAINSSVHHGMVYDLHTDARAGYIVMYVIEGGNSARVGFGGDLKQEPGRDYVRTKAMELEVLGEHNVVSVIAYWIERYDREELAHGNSGE